MQKTKFYVHYNIGDCSRRAIVFSGHKLYEGKCHYTDIHLKYGIQEEYFKRDLACW